MGDGERDALGVDWLTDNVDPVMKGGRGEGGTNCLENTPGDLTLVGEALAADRSSFRVFNKAGVETDVDGSEGTLFTGGAAENTFDIRGAGAGTSAPTTSSVPSGDDVRP